jgi:Uma2 family endonuclease
MKTLKWTIQDYHRLIATGILCDRHVEFLEGDIVQVSPEGPLHAFITTSIAEYFRSLLQGIAHIREAHPITLSNSEPQTDIAIVRLPASLYRDRHPLPADIFWLIEVSQSTLNYDLEDKKRVYARDGIQEYWIIQLDESQIRVFRSPNNGDYSTAEIISSGAIAPSAFPNIKIELERLLP